jgi:hypothetical protein
MNIAVQGSQSRSGLPFAGGDGLFLNLAEFEGLNTQAARQSIGDQEFAWLENLMPVTDGELRSIPSNGAATYTSSAGTTVVYMIDYNIGATTYRAIFQSDGTAYQLNIATGLSTTISTTPGTFYNGTVLPACAQWGSQGIVIVGTITGDDYWAWDGTTLYAAGSASPSWLNGGTSTTMPSGIQGTGH